MIAIKLCTCYNSYAVVACAKFCTDMIPYVWVKPKPIFHWTWIMMENCLWNGPQTLNRVKTWYDYHGVLPMSGGPEMIFLLCWQTMNSQNTPHTSWGMMHLFWFLWRKNTMKYQVCTELTLLCAKSACQVVTPHRWTSNAESPLMGFILRVPIFDFLTAPGKRPLKP